jgi:hypothetical protein
VGCFKLLAFLCVSDVLALAKDFEYITPWTGSFVISTPYNMEDEVAKHTRKIYRAWKNPQHPVVEKVKEIIIEIFIIVFAVTISIWFHNWSDHRHEQNEVKEFLRGLKDDLTEDIKQLQTNKNVTAELDSSYHFLFSIQKNEVKSKAINDSLIYHNLYFDLRVTRPNIGRYEGFKSSGKIGNIENDSLKQHILVFYEQTIPHLVYGEDFVNGLQQKLLDLQIDKSAETTIKDFVTSTKIRGLLSFATQNFENNIDGTDGYNDAIKRAKRIILEIDNDQKK